MSQNIRTKTKTQARLQAKGQTLSPELWEYVHSSKSTAEIAARFGISLSTLTVRAKRAGLTLRKRGRWPLSEPSSVQKEILAFAAIHGGNEAALRFGISKQRVSKLQRRWSASTVLGQVNAKNGRFTANPCKIRFYLEPAVFDQLEKVLKHPWFPGVSSRNEAARLIVTMFLAGEIRSLKNGRVAPEKREAGSR